MRACVETSYNDTRDHTDQHSPRPQHHHSSLRIQIVERNWSAMSCAKVNENPVMDGSFRRRASVSDVSRTYWFS